MPWLLCCAARVPQCWACRKGPAIGSRKEHQLHQYIMKTPLVVVALFLDILNGAPQKWHQGQYMVRGPAASCVCVWALAVDDRRRRRAEPPPSCFELLPCKTSHMCRCSNWSDRVPSIWCVKQHSCGAYLSHDEIARTLPLLCCADVVKFCAQKLK